MAKTEATAAREPRTAAIAAMSASPAGLHHVGELIVECASDSPSLAEWTLAPTCWRGNGQRSGDMICNRVQASGDELHRARS